MNIPLILGIYLGIINLIAFITYGIDKNKAERHKFRIPEATLILLAAVGGGLGALLGMLSFRHKTRKPKFCILVPIFLAVWVAITLFLILKK